MIFIIFISTLKNIFEWTNLEKKNTNSTAITIGALGLFSKPYFLPLSDENDIVWYLRISGIVTNILSLFYSEYNYYNAFF